MHILYISWLALVLAFIFFTVCYFLIKKQAKKIDALQLIVKTLLASNDSVKKQLIEVHSAVLEWDEKFKSLIC